MATVGQHLIYDRERGHVGHRVLPVEPLHERIAAGRPPQAHVGPNVAPLLGLVASALGRLDMYCPQPAVDC